MECFCPFCPSQPLREYSSTISQRHSTTLNLDELTCWPDVQWSAGKECVLSVAGRKSHTVHNLHFTCCSLKWKGVGKSSIKFRWIQLQMDSGKSKLILRKVQSLLPCHMLYVEVNEKSALLREPLRKQGSWSGQQLIGSLKLGNICFFCTADFRSSLVYEWAEQKPKHCLTTGLFIASVNFDTPLISVIYGRILKPFGVVTVITVRL